MNLSSSTDQDDVEHLVVIGSSAGGIDALGELVSTLPLDFRAPIVVVQHLDPRRESHLAQILQRRTRLPIRIVAARERLDPGVIFVIPADREVVIGDHEIRARRVRQGPGDAPRTSPRPSVDGALDSAAEAYGEGLIAVILTGAGSDGAAGARHVKAVGGTVVIQNPETASYPAMPLSLSPTTVDIVADLKAIGPLLQDLLAGTFVPRRSDEEGVLTTFLEAVRESTGIDFAQYKRPTVLRRLQRRIVATGQDGLREYVRYAHGHPEELQRLANSFLINVTEFFRDPDLYEHLRAQLLPQLFAHAGEHSGEVRIWSAGCATGEEAYSLAIVATEAREAGGGDLRVRIFATDVDGEAIAFARRGIYPAAALARLPEALRQRHFLERDGQYEVAPALRTLIAFGQHDLAQRAPFPRIDLTVCRNVLIYFTAELQRRALQLFAFALRDGGYLVLGKSETTTPLADAFVLADPRLKIYRRRGTRVGRPSGRMGSEPLRPMTVLPPPTTPRASLARGIAPSRGAAELDRARTHAARADRIVMQLPVGIVVVDRKYDIALINTAARNLLGVHGAAIGQDLVHLVEGVPNNELRREIDDAFRGEPARRMWDIPVADSTSGELMSLEVTCYRQGDGTSTAETVAILVRDVTREHADLSGLRQASSSQTDRAERLAVQIRRMTEAARRLREANAELTMVNADLRSQNDDLVVSNEEVQSATEEVETLNEELQATNEELETLNEELQATVEELNTTNDDLEARSTELQDLAISVEHQRELSESERARLEGVLLSMADAVVVTDPTGAPVLSNGVFDRTFGSAVEVRLEDEAGEEIPPDRAPWRLPVREGTFLVRFTGTEASGERHWYEARGRALDDDPAGGAVTVIRDVTATSLQHLQDEFVAMLSHELRTPAHRGDRLPGAPRARASRQPARQVAPLCGACALAGPALLLARVGPVRCEPAAERTAALQLPGGRPGGRRGGGGRHVTAARRQAGDRPASAVTSHSPRRRFGPSPAGRAQPDLERHSPRVELADD